MRYTALVLVLALVGCGSSPQKSLKLSATPHSVTLTWTQGVVQSGSPAVTGNNVYRGTTSGGETLLTSLATPSTSYVDTAVTAGSTYYYEVTATNGTESGKSNEAVATIPNPQAPGAPVLGNPTVVSTTAPCVASPYNVWTNVTLPPQTANFELQFDSTPSASKADGVMTLYSPMSTKYTGNTSVPLLFSSAGTIQAYNGSAFSAVNAVSYVGGATYHFTLDVNMSAHTYSAYVGSTTRTAIASNYAFRASAGMPASLGFMGLLQDAAQASNKICNATILSYPIAS